jgi:hypothetical protein
MKSLALAALAAFAIAAPAFAADPAPGAPSAPAVKPGKAAKPEKPKPNPSDKLICTREEDTGSFLSKRVCRTQAQIDAERRDAQMMEDYRQSLGNRVGVGGGPAN